MIIQLKGQLNDKKIFPLFFQLQPSSPPPVHGKAGAIYLEQPSNIDLFGKWLVDTNQNDDGEALSYLYQQATHSTRLDSNQAGPAVFVVLFSRPRLLLFY